jgi:hypothetical protein
MKLSDQYDRSQFTVIVLLLQWISQLAGELARQQESQPDNCNRYIPLLRFTQKIVSVNIFDRSSS